MNRVLFDEGFAYRLVNGYDVDGKFGLEVPSIFIHSLKSAIEGNHFDWIFGNAFKFFKIKNK